MGRYIYVCVYIYYQKKEKIFSFTYLDFYLKKKIYPHYPQLTYPFLFDLLSKITSPKH